ncbi:MAG TPA: hypothetical protein VHN17_13220 [Steroidobacteraceae bacterium]|jgi:hypothetical protein|nr:hypothetical protein [Steroidobacteraceae bacterium]
MDPEQFASMGAHARAVTGLAVDRRGCMRLCIGLLGVLWLGRAVGGREDLPPAGDLQSWLQHFGPGRLGDPMALSRLGAIYLASHPGEREPQHLSRLILSDRAGPVELVLIETIARDWSKHDVAQVDGWVLSRTEARICAAVHLMGGGPG